MNPDPVSGNDSPIFLARNTRSHQAMPPGGPDPSAHWGRRYERTRDDLLERFVIADSIRT